MNLNEALNLPSLSHSSVLAGQSHLDSLISGVMVLEALDVEKWSHPGELILTSYFALQNLDENGLENFIKNSVTVKSAPWLSNRSVFLRIFRLI